MSTPLGDRLDNEKPMDSALNSAHSFIRRAENHLKFGRYDDAIKCHKETVNYLSKAITESTIPQNIEILKEQRKYHEKIQQIIARQKQEFDEFLLRNGLKAVSQSHRPSSLQQLTKENQENFPATVNNGTVANHNTWDACDDNEFFSLVGDLRIDENNVDIEMDPVTAGDSDNDEYFSLNL